ncbi:hypothetical protein LTR37_008719 [Vermiconidia calcicola]|uniref:Uncharacterized protein n=1 Tax=Vermiconidia calcicola TaxID=1690605 RepID=A0ACC3N9Y1_9PEZI|nr:hypothetical protein LTR37_008719 [Vermiconidia calcicola]
MSFEQIKITWIMMLVQGGRRLYECLTLTEGEEENFGSNRPASMMFAGHWVLGMLFYSALSVAFWIEGIPALQAHQLSPRDLIFKAPIFRTIFSIIVFILASGFQHDCHAYLAYLKKSKSKSSEGKVQDASENEYKLPSHPAFQPLIAPHYTAECVIYLSFALVSAPQGALVNVTMLCAMVFVVVNLGVTADVTKKWYERRFGPEAWSIYAIQTFDRPPQRSYSACKRATYAIGCALHDGLLFSRIPATFGAEERFGHGLLRKQTILGRDVKMIASDGESLLEFEKNLALKPDLEVVLGETLGSYLSA